VISTIPGHTHALVREVMSAQVSLADALYGIANNLHTHADAIDARTTVDVNAIKKFQTYTFVENLKLKRDISEAAERITELALVTKALQEQERPPPTRPVPKSTSATSRRGVTTTTATMTIGKTAPKTQPEIDDTFFGTSSTTPTTNPVLEPSKGLLGRAIQRSPGKEVLTADGGFKFVANAKEFSAGLAIDTGRDIAYQDDPKKGGVAGLFYVIYKDRPTLEDSVQDHGRLKRYLDEFGARIAFIALVPSSADVAELRKNPQFRGRVLFSVLHQRLVIVDDPGNRDEISRLRDFSWV